ncbi:MAG TPA: ABC transporter permease [Anaerolineaceae bacterium]|nr:ABC transporter permease [Anaerolineaceae bacterium]
MRKLLAMAWNDLRIEFSERATLVFFLLLPLLFTVIVGQGLSGMNGGAEEGSYPILVVDADRSPLSQRLVAALDAEPGLQVTTTTAAGREAALAESAALAALTLPPGFGAALQAGEAVTVELETTGEDLSALAAVQEIENTLGLIDSAVAAAAASVAEARQIRPFAGAQAEQAYFEGRLAAALESMLQAPPAEVHLTQPAGRAEVNTGSSFTQASTGQLVTWTLITLFGASEVFVNERLLGTLRRLIATPTRGVTILLAKITGRLAMGWVQMAILIGFGALALGVDWGRSPGALALMVVSFSLAAVAFGVLLGTFATTRSQASGLTTLFAMVFAALGGAWWPLEITPPVYQTVVKALPTTWAMLGFNDVILRGAGVAEVLPEAGILLGFAALFFALSLPRMRFE